jgi:Helicase associated domain
MKWNWNRTNDETSFNVTTVREDNKAPEECVTTATINQLYWDDMYEILVEYTRNQRRCHDLRYAMNISEEERNTIQWIWDGNVPQKYITSNGKALGKWINTQRTAKTDRLLHPKREARLHNLGLNWRCK